MPVKEITSEAEYRTILSKGVVFVDFYADWCGPCRTIGPVFVQLSDKHKGMGTFIKVNADHHKTIMQSAGVRAFPTFHAYVNGNKVGEVVGADPNALAALITTHGKREVGEGHALGGAAVAGAEGQPYPMGMHPLAARAAAQQAAAASATPPAANDPMMEDDADIQAAIAMSLQADEAPRSPEAAPGNKGKKVVCDGDVCKMVTDDEPAAAGEAAGEAAGDGDGAKPAAKLPPVNEGYMAQLKDMGIPEIRAYKGLLFTQNSTVEAALNWVMEHADDADIDEALTVVEAPAPLSAEEAKAKAAELVRKARERREAAEKEAEKERELNLRKMGKDLTEIKRQRDAKDLEELQARIKAEKKREADEKKRMKALLEADKIKRILDRENRDRAAKGLPPLSELPAELMPANAAPKAAAAAAAAPAANLPAKRSAPAAAVSAAAVPGATECVLQIRLPNGQTLTETFKPSAKMAEVVQFISEKKGDGVPFRLMTPFPRKVFGEGDMDRTLTAEGLVPRSIIILTQ